MANSYAEVCAVMISCLAIEGAFKQSKEAHFADAVL